MIFDIFRNNICDIIAVEDCVMSRFNIVKKGYDVSEVEGYIARQTLSDNKCLQEKSMRIEELLVENNCLKGQLVQYKSREANVNDALITAIDKAQEMEYVAKMRYELELERVKTFRDKWIRYCDSMKDKCDIKESKGEVIGVLDSLETELSDSICSGIKFNLRELNTDAELQFRDEASRILNKLQTGGDIRSPFERIIESDEQINDKIAKSSNIECIADGGNLMSIDNLDEIPSEISDIINNPDFEELCKKLGLA